MFHPSGHLDGSTSFRINLTAPQGERFTIRFYAHTHKSNLQVIRKESFKVSFTWLYLRRLHLDEMQAQAEEEAMVT
jgi:hypothetical protein